MFKKIIEEYYLNPFVEFAEHYGNAWTPIGEAGAEISDSEIIYILEALSQLSPSGAFEARKIISIADKLVSEAGLNEYRKEKQNEL